MTLLLGLAFAALGLAVLAAPALAARRERTRLEQPGLVALCMDFDAPRQARLELRIQRPASRQDWTIRRVDWLEPAAARIAARPNAPCAERSLAVELRPREDGGRWFASAAELWVRYAGDGAPPHRVRLRLALEYADGRRRSLLVSAVFPAMHWAPRPTAVRIAPAPQPPASLPRGRAWTWEPRSWRPASSHPPGASGVA